MQQISTRPMLTTSALASVLGVGTSMARRYGLALEAITGQPLRQIPGKGRMYLEEEVQLLQEARQLVLQDPSLSIEDALKSVMGVEGVPSSELLVERAERPSGPSLEAIQGLLSQALGPVAVALQQLQEQNQLLREELEGLKALPAPLLDQDELQREREQTRKLVELYRVTLEEKKQEIELLEKRRKWWLW